MNTPTIIGCLFLAAAPEPDALAGDPTLAALIAEALAARPELKSAQAIIDAQRQLAPPARALPDPMFEAGIQNDGFERLMVGHMETSWVSLMLAQTVPWPGKLMARGRIADLAPKQGELLLERLRLTTEADVSRAFIDLMLARERLALLARLESVWRQSAELARSRYEVGEGAQSEVLRAQLEVNRLKLRRLSLQVEETQSLQAINRLRAVALDTGIETGARLRELELPGGDTSSAVADDALARSPELASARVTCSTAEAAVAAAKQSWGPDLTFRAGVMSRGTALPPMWLVSIGASLPVWGALKQAPALREAEARLRAARDELQAVEQRVRLRTAQREAARQALRKTVHIYREGLLVQSEATASSTLAQYKVGKVGFLAVLEANAGYIGDEDSYLRALADTWRVAIAAREVSLDTPSMAGGAAIAAPLMSGSIGQDGTGAPAEGM